MNEKRMALTIAWLVMAFIVPVIAETSSIPEYIRRDFTNYTDFNTCFRDTGIVVSNGNPSTVLLGLSDLVTDDIGNHLTRKIQFDGKLAGKKTFDLDAVDCSQVEIFLFHGTGNALLNGHPICFTNAELSSGWSVARAEPSLLKKGCNELVFTNGFALGQDADRRPARHSFVSHNGGKNWEEATEGEFLIHFRFVRHPEKGVITSGVVDLNNPDNANIICPLIVVNKLTITAQTATPRGTEIKIEARTGNTACPDASWSDWNNIDKKIIQGRYVQWRAILRTKNRMVTPILKGLTIEAQAERKADAAEQRLTVNRFDNQRIARSSYPYTFQHPSKNLKYLRDNWKLDDVVAKGTNEFERLLLLRNWARRQWPCNDMGSGKRTWNAIEILSAATNQHGMCVHFATVFTQCAMALGYNARPVILNHHFVADVWSDDFGKWVLMDVEAVHPEGFTKFGTAHYVDAATRMPLDIIDLHREQFAAIRSGQALVDSVIQMYAVDTDNGPHNLLEKKRSPKEISVFQLFAMPLRNNFLDQLEPWEAFHGEDNYHSDAYLWWQDAAPLGFQKEYSLQTDREADIRWTVNQAELSLTATDSPKKLTVTINTFTPNFKKFIYRTDGGAWQSLTTAKETDATQTKLDWVLKKGINILEVKPVNAFDREGMTSRVEVNADL